MNLREVRKKIKSVKNVGKITRAMQLVSAVKMRKAQEIALEGRAYRDKLTEITRKIFGNIDYTYSPLLQLNNAQRDLVILVSSSKGLCGSFNFNLFKFLDNEVKIKNSDFITVGRKGAEFIARMKGRIIADFSVKNPEESVKSIFNIVLLHYLKGEYKNVYVVYSRFVSTLKYEPVKVCLLPVAGDLSMERGLKVSENYLIEPDPKNVVDSLLKDFIEEKIREAILDNEASEHSARMIAMKNATDNAKELSYHLTLVHNKLRQEKITNELLDMVTAKESVEEEGE